MERVSGIRSPIMVLYLFFFFLIKKRNKKNQGRKDYIPFLPGSYVQRLYYCRFNIISLLLNSSSLLFSESFLNLNLTGKINFNKSKTISNYKCWSHSSTKAKSGNQPEKGMYWAKPKYLFPGSFFFVTSSLGYLFWRSKKERQPAYCTDRIKL